MNERFSSKERIFSEQFVCRIFVDSNLCEKKNIKNWSTWETEHWKKTIYLRARANIYNIISVKPLFLFNYIVHIWIAFPLNIILNPLNWYFAQIKQNINTVHNFFVRQYSDWNRFWRRQFDWFRFQYSKSVQISVQNV